MSYTEETEPLSAAKLHSIADDVLSFYNTVKSQAASGDYWGRRKTAKAEQLMLECHSKLLELARDASRREAESCRSREPAWADYEPM